MKVYKKFTFYHTTQNAASSNINHSVSKTANNATINIITLIVTVNVNAKAVKPIAEMAAATVIKNTAACVTTIIQHLYHSDILCRLFPI